MANLSVNIFRQGKKTKIFAILIIAILALSVYAVTVSNVAKAQAASLTVPQWTFMHAFPSPIGINQTMSLYAWTTNYPPTANGGYGDRWSMSIVVTAPDGTNTTLGPFVSDPVGTIFEHFTPTQLGTYTFQAFTAAHTLTNSPNGIDPTEVAQAQAFATANHLPLTVGESIFVTGFSDLGNTYPATASPPVNATVQSTPIPTAVTYPLPTEYWTTPVSQAGNTANWQYLTGDWLSQGTPQVLQNGQFGNAYTNDFTQAPQSAHIMWTKPINFGGIAGLTSSVASGQNGYYSYLSYEGMFNPPIIMNGQLYYNTPNPPEYGFVDVDLHTGQTVWYQNGTAAWSGTNSPNPVQIGFGFAKQNYPQLAFGQELNYESPNQAGVMDYLWATWTATNGSTVWSMFDPFTGNWICNLWNIPAAGAIFGASNMVTDPQGDLLTYNVVLGANSSAVSTISVWNSTDVIQNTSPSKDQTNGYWMWRPPLGGQIDASKETKVYNLTNTSTLPASAFGTVNTNFGPAPAASLTFMDVADQLAIYSSAPATLGVQAYPTPANYINYAVSTAPDSIGQVKWAQTYTWPSSNVTIIAGACGDGMFTLFQKETRLWIGYSATTGQLVWTSSTPEVTDHIYGVTTGIYNGVLYSGDSIGEGGTIYAYDVKTGDLLWQSGPTSMGYQGYWSSIPTSIGAIVGGTIFWSSGEHSPAAVLEPGFMIGNINATTGASIWNITFWNGGGGFNSAFASSDGYMTALNVFDGQIYAFSKGPTQTTVQTPLNAIIQGNGLTIQGTVTDISPGTKQSAQSLRFPDGVPAVSDDSQTAWMEYVYMQNPKPTNATGVNVSIDAIDPNGNSINLGTTHSDSSGLYSFQVTPNMLSAGTGTYTIIATFSGSNSYWPSSSESTFSVEAPTATATPASTTATSSPVDTYFLPAVAIIIIILVVGIALIMMMLRRRP